jgi:hypothetical protein
MKNYNMGRQARRIAANIANLLGCIAPLTQIHQVGSMPVCGVEAH